MTRLAKSAAYVVIGLAVFLAGAITLTIGWRPFLGPQVRPLSDRKFERTPVRLARGEYLVRNVADCMGCHAEHDWTAHDAPLLPNALGAGQDMTIVKDLPGKIYASNITPDPETGAGNWSDDQLARAVREGVGHDGRALFPFMPYLRFQAMSDEDLASVIVYLRSIPAVRRPLPPTQLIFPVSYLIRSAPKPVTDPVPEPDLSTPEKRGKYLVTIAGCAGCHTPQDSHGQPLANMDFSGGTILEGPWGPVASANITPDPSGIASYDQTTFTQAMRTGYVKSRKLNQIMPWHAYRGMTEEDNNGIFAYLKTLPTIQHHVDNTQPPTYCKLCRQSHGGGSQN
jgi:Cytochrome c